eukprot:COSAG01_NODE_274_length_19734_cov_122.033512_20_plen_155_part_00
MDNSSPARAEAQPPVYHSSQTHSQTGHCTDRQAGRQAGGGIRVSSLAPAVLHLPLQLGVFLRQAVGLVLVLALLPALGPLVDLGRQVALVVVVVALAPLRRRSVPSKVGGDARLRSAADALQVRHRHFVRNTATATATLLETTPQGASLCDTTP